MFLVQGRENEQETVSGAHWSAPRRYQVRSDESIRDILLAVSVVAPDCLDEVGQNLQTQSKIDSTTLAALREQGLDDGVEEARWISEPGQGADSMGLADLLEEVPQHARELALSLFQAAEILRRQPLRQRWIGIQMWRQRRLQAGAFLVGLVEQIGRNARDRMEGDEVVVGTRPQLLVAERHEALVPRERNAMARQNIPDVHVLGPLLLRQVPLGPGKSRFRPASAGASSPGCR